MVEAARRAIVVNGKRLDLAITQVSKKQAQISQLTKIHHRYQSAAKLLGSTAYQSANQPTTSMDFTADFIVD